MTEERLDTLLLRWQENKQRGTELSASDLCGDCPELAEELSKRIDFLRRMEDMMQTRLSSADAGSGTIQQEPGVVANADDDLARLSSLLSPPQSGGELGRLGKYRILAVLGRGGMGVVFKGEDPKLKRSVAIKAMLPGLAGSKTAGERFLREAQAIAAIEHDHIVRVYQVDEDRGVPFMAMEFLKGQTLEDYLQKGRKLPLAEVLRIGQETAKALAAAHKAGMIHRDIKPGNIWLEKSDEFPEGRVKLLDFGLARAAEGTTELTHQGSILGTPSFMAPEQARGEKVDARVDLWSLGVVLYRLTTGQQPFSGRDVFATIFAINSHQPRTPAELSGEVPAPLSELIMKLLEKDPGRRLATSQEVVDTLRRLKNDDSQSSGEQKPSAPATTQIQPAPTAPGRRLLLSVALACALAALAAGIVFYWPTSQGTIRIEVNDPTIKVAVDNGEFTFSGAEKQDIHVAPGPHGLRVKRGDLELETDKFVLKKAETITLKVEWFKDGKVQVLQGDKVIGEKGVAEKPGAATNVAKIPKEKERLTAKVPAPKGQTPSPFDAVKVLVPFYLDDFRLSQSQAAIPVGRGSRLYSCHAVMETSRA